MPTNINPKKLSRGKKPSTPRGVKRTSRLFDKRNEPVGEHHWIGVQPTPHTHYGFVYLIRSLLTGKGYIGRKFYHSYRSNRCHSPSDWRTYCGSNLQLLKDIQSQGKDNFTFEILRQFVTRGSVLYAEANIQHKYDVLTSRLKNGERAYYNGNISAVKFIPKVDKTGTLL